MKSEFCNIAKVENRFWLSREEYVGGPRLGLLPPEELTKDMPLGELGARVILALDAFFNAGRKLRPLDWERHEAEAATFYNVKNSRVLRAKIRNFTIRRTGLEICFFNGKTGLQFMDINYVDDFSLGQKVLQAIEDTFRSIR